MDKYADNKYGYYKKHSTDELVERKNELVDDINYMLDVVDSEKGTLRRSEFLNVDLRCEKDELEYIENLLKERDFRSKSR